MKIFYGKKYNWLPDHKAVAKHKKLIMKDTRTKTLETIMKDPYKEITNMIYVIIISGLHPDLIYFVNY